MTDVLLVYDFVCKCWVFVPLGVGKTASGTGNVFPLLIAGSSGHPKQKNSTSSQDWNLFSGCDWCLILHFFGLPGSRLVSDSGLPRIVHHPSDVVVRVGNPATLSCRAEGNPEPTIQWLRNGQPLDTDKMDAQSRPIVLPEGSLFFLNVVSGRKSQSHEAVYACVARNSAGIATSRNASLHIAGLKWDVS